MKRITCEMCGSTDLLKKDGVFECQSCGTKYTVEEAKKMMVEGTVNVEGTVKIDNSAQIDNFLKLASSATESKNYKEAENYANKIIEIAPNNYRAWLIKGKAAGWESTLNNIRFAESIECWSNAVEHCDEDKMEETKNEIIDEATKLFKVLINMLCQRFAEYPDSDEADRLLNVDILLDNIMSLISKADLEIDSNELFEYAAYNMDVSAVKGRTTANDYYGKNQEDKNRYKYTTWIEYMDNCIRVLEFASKLSKKKETIELIFNNMKMMQEDLIGSCSYKFYANSYFSGYDVDTQLTASSIAIRRAAILSYPGKKKKLLDELEKEQAEKIEKYWEEHSEEKEELEEKISTTKKKIEELHNNINTNKAKKEELKKEQFDEVKPLIEKINSISEKATKLNKELKDLGLFKSKEKEIIKKEIEKHKEAIANITNKIFETRENIKAKQEKDLTKIDSKITKDTEELDKLVNKLEEAMMKRYEKITEDTKKLRYVEEDVYFCERCGAEFTGVPGECPECGIKFSYENQFICPNCGKRFEGQKSSCPHCGIRFT